MGGGASSRRSATDAAAQAGAPARAHNSGAGVRPATHSPAVPVPVDLPVHAFTPSDTQPSGQVDRAEPALALRPSSVPAAGVPPSAVIGGPRASWPSSTALQGTPPPQQQPGGSLESDSGLITDILLAIGREELADNPASVELLKDILRQTNGDPFRAADLIKDIMADTAASSPPTPRHPSRMSMQEPAVLERTGSNFQEAIYQDVLRKAGGDEGTALRMMRGLGLEPPPSTRSTSPGRPPTAGEAAHQPEAAACSRPGGGNLEIFLDIVRQNNGDISQGVKKMVELGITMDDQAITAAADALAREASIVGTPPTGDHQQTSADHRPELDAPLAASGPTPDSMSTISVPAHSLGSMPAPSHEGGSSFAIQVSNSTGSDHYSRPPSHMNFPIARGSLAAPGSLVAQAEAGLLLGSSAFLPAQPTQPNSGNAPAALAAPRQLPPPSRQSTARQAQQPLLRTYQALAAATDNFARGNLLGAGGFGAVYRGVLPDGTSIAVKKLDTSGLQGEREFQREIKILGKYQSPYVVKLLGYTLDEAAYCLVYELMDGSLDTRLEQGPTLTWQNRIAIAMQSAAGLAYLHRGTTFPLAHMDVKSANVLLREDGGAFSFAKIGDVGLAQLQISVDGMSITNLNSGPLSMRRGAPMPSMTMTMGSVATTSTLRGSNGYLDPVYLETGRGGSSNDVFAFGVVLLELITGRPAIYRSNAGTGPAVMLANAIGGRMVAIGNGCPVHEGFSAQLLEYTKTVADSHAGSWPEWALDALGCCAVCCLLPDRSLRVKMDALMVRLAELHTRAGGVVPDGVLQVCEAVGMPLSA